MTTEPIETTSDVEEPVTLSPELEALAPDSNVVTLVSGREVEIERLKTRGLMALMRIFTHGASETFAELFGMDIATEDFTVRFVVEILSAMGESENETIEFLNKMVVPKGYHRGSRISKEQMEENFRMEADLRDELADPDYPDLLTIVTKIVQNEAPHVRALGKQLSTLMSAWKKNDTAKRGASSKESSGS